MTSESLHGALRTSATLMVLLAMLLANPSFSELQGPEPKALLHHQHLSFDVYFNDRRVGEHVFDLAHDQDGQTRVRSMASFTARLLFVPVYRYQHQASESWQAGCLQALTAVTDDNGTQFEVSMQRKADQLVISQSAPDVLTTQIAAPCPATYAYWDLALLRRAQLINAQTGSVDDSKLIERGIESLDGVPARRFTLESQEGSIELWYRASDLQWIGLRSAQNGGTLSYRPAS